MTLYPCILRHTEMIFLKRNDVNQLARRGRRHRSGFLGWNMQGTSPKLHVLHVEWFIKFKHGGGKENVR